jgi:hypothetical protein
MKKIPDINLNQNLWALLISLSSLGVAEYFQLQKLEQIAYILTIMTGLSCIFTLIAYTINYWKRKLNP